MLIRIAPDMFIDDRFDCVTVQEVCEEINPEQFKIDNLKQNTLFKLHGTITNHIYP